MKQTMFSFFGSMKVVEVLFRHLLGASAAIVMFLMMSLTFLDVIGRYFLSSPINGAYELTEMMLAAVIFLGLPLVTAEGGHIAVDILDDFFGRLAKLVQYIFIETLNVVSFTTLAWVLWQHTQRLQRFSDSTAVLQVPLSWLALMMTVTTCIAALALIIRAIIFLPKIHNVGS